MQLNKVQMPKRVYLSVKRGNMLGKIKPDLKQNLFKIRPTDLINLGHPLVKLVQEISWGKMEIEFQDLYSE